MSEPKTDHVANMRGLLEAKGIPRDDELASLAISVAALTDRAETALERISVGRTPEAEERFAARVTDTILGRFGASLTKVQQWIVLRYVLYAALILAGTNLITGTALYVIGRSGTVSTAVGPASQASVGIVQANGGLDAIMARCARFTPKTGGEACDLPSVWITPPQPGR